MDIDTHGGEGSDSAMSAAGKATGALDFTTQRGNADGADWQEEVYQKKLMQLQQLTAQLPAHQMSQLLRMTDANDLNMKQQMGMKTGVLQQQQSVGRRVGFNHPQVKFKMSSPQAYEGVSPQRQN